MAQLLHDEQHTQDQHQDKPQANHGAHWGAGFFMLIIAGPGIPLPVIAMPIAIRSIVIGHQALSRPSCTAWQATRTAPARVWPGFSTRHRSLASGQRG